jgi:hypothetical protein
MMAAFMSYDPAPWGAGVAGVRFPARAMAGGGGWPDYGQPKLSGIELERHDRGIHVAWDRRPGVCLHQEPQLSQHR